jgi:hypothetical protein
MKQAKSGWKHASTLVPAWPGESSVKSSPRCDLAALSRRKPRPLNGARFITLLVACTAMAAGAWAETPAPATAPAPSTAPADAAPLVRLVADKLVGETVFTLRDMTSGQDIASSVDLPPETNAD